MKTKLDFNASMRYKNVAYNHEITYIQGNLDKRLRIVIQWYVEHEHNTSTGKLVFHAYNVDKSRYLFQLFSGGNQRHEIYCAYSKSNIREYIFDVLYRFPALYMYNTLGFNPKRIERVKVRCSDEEMNTIWHPEYDFEMDKKLKETTNG